MNSALLLCVYSNNKVFEVSYILYTETSSFDHVHVHVIYEMETAEFVILDRMSRESRRNYAR